MTLGQKIYMRIMDMVFGEDPRDVAASLMAIAITVLQQNTTLSKNEVIESLVQALNKEKEESNENIGS